LIKKIFFYLTLHVLIPKRLYKPHVPRKPVKKAMPAGMINHHDVVKVNTRNIAAIT